MAPPAADIGIQPDEAGELAAGLDHLLGEGGPDCAGVVLLPVLQGFEDLELAAVIVGDGEGHQAFERHAVAAVFLQQLRRDAGQLHPFQDKAFLDAEAAGHLGGSFALVDEGGERLELVGRVHGQPDGVLGQAHFQGMVLGDDLARHREILGQLALGLKRTDRLQAPAPGDDAKRAVAARR